MVGKITFYYLYKAGYGGIVKGSRKNCPLVRELKRWAAHRGQGYEVRARARGRAGEIWRGRAERIAARYRNGEEGRLSQRWLSQKLWKFQVGTIHDLGPPNHQLAGWEMKNAAVRNNQIQLDVAPLILINPTTPLPYFLIITIAILLEWHIPK